MQTEERVTEPCLDPLFEEAIKNELPGVRDAARLLYYGGFAYEVLAGEDRVPEPKRPPNRGILIARHSAEEQDRSLEITQRFDQKYPGRARRFCYIPPKILRECLRTT